MWQNTEKNNWKKHHNSSQDLKYITILLLESTDIFSLYVPNLNRKPFSDFEDNSKQNE
jgi:hypothetical protein